MFTSTAKLILEKSSTLAKVWGEGLTIPTTAVSIGRISMTKKLAALTKKKMSD
jgi:hypothetical protein